MTTARISPIRAVLGVAVGAILLLGLRSVSLVPMKTSSAGESVLRLSWSARPERIEDCRRLSDEELEQLPTHMRLRWQCEGRFARYMLTVSVDGSTIFADTVRGGGLRNDRPMHLFREVGIEPGTRQLAVRLVRLDTVSAPAEDSTTDQVAEGSAAFDRETREAQERRTRRAEQLPEALVLDTLINIQARRVVLVSYDNAGQKLVLHTGE